MLDDGVEGRSQVTGSRLEAVKDCLRYLVHETRVHTEITTLLIPGLNDDADELHTLCAWVREDLGPEIPLHFTAFHPDFKLQDKGRTPSATLGRARELAKQAGVRHVYTGNVHDADGQSTYCHGCGARVIERDWYELGEWQLSPDGGCRHCGELCAGRFAGPPGTWGRQRRSVIIEEYAR